MHVVVATHGHCFDGLASSAVFTRLYRTVTGQAARFTYRACGYGPNQQKPSLGMLNGDDNAILDFRFLPAPQLSWYFDHHRTAFASEADQRVFEARPERDRLFFDPNYSSCAKLIADVAERQFGQRDEALRDLVNWADTIDAARFDSPEQAVSRTDPVMRLVSVVEHYGDDAFYNTWVPRLLDRPLAEVARAREIEDRYKPLGDKHQAFVQRVREKLERRGRVVYVDLTESAVDSVGKFVTYALCPDSVYSVIVALMGGGVKISIGYNPWSGQPLDTDISAICARHGGGGHPVVGGISFRAAELGRARLVAREIADELEQGR